jgi:hypothetical protein
LPDLILWDAAAKTCIFSEVKGPTDRLSDKQSIWLDVLARAAHLSSVPNKVLVHVIHVSSKPDVAYDDDDLECVDNDAILEYRENVLEMDDGSKPISNENHELMEVEGSNSVSEI